MIEKKIRGLKDFELKTGVERHLLTPGQVLMAQFKSQEQFESLLSLDVFEEAGEDAVIQKPLQIIPPPADSPHDDYSLQTHVMIPPEQQPDDGMMTHTALPEPMTSGVGMVLEAIQARIAKAVPTPAKPKPKASNSGPRKGKKRR